ncbi:MAG: EamA family transporter RarD, partial [Sphingomicrobium sp.]
MNKEGHKLAAAHKQRNGYLYGLAAYGLWGVMPFYFKLIADIGPLDIVAHRILWSVPFLFLLVGLSKGRARLVAAVRAPRTLAILALTAVLIAINWLLFVYSVVNGYILAASLGYYLNPLGNVLLGRFVLGERLSRLQWAAVSIAAGGIAVLAAGAVGQLWISLTLCVTFAFYGLLRKVVAADAITGLTIETALLFPVALGWLAFQFAIGVPVFGTGSLDAGLLVFAGIATTTPLLAFTAAARRLDYSTLGMLQFLAPTLQFLLAVFFYGERLTTAHAIAFAAIWTALALYV